MNLNGVSPRGLVLAAVLLLSACGQEAEIKGPVYATSAVESADTTYQFAVHPLHNPEQLVKSYQPLLDHLNARTDGLRFQLEASRDYAEYERKFRARGPEFLLPNPWQSLEAMKVGYSVIAMAGEPDDFRGIFLVRKESSIREVADLKGKTVGYPSPTALAACIMPQWFLFQHGLDVKTEVVNQYVGSQESAIMNVYLGQTVASATWPPPWRKFQKEHPKEAEHLKVIWETPPLINNAVMVRDDVAPQVRDRIRRVLLELHQSPEGADILAGLETARFYPADDARYEQVREFVKQFEAKVRPVEQP